MTALACLAAAMATIGTAVSVGGWFAVRALPQATPLVDTDCPGITVLRPLFRDEPMLEEALLSACRQDYPRFQVVFGVQDPSDPALAVVERVRARLPECDIAVVLDDTADGVNRKIANLANMLAVAKYDVLVIADSDIHVGPGYLRAIAAELAVPGTGLVTTLYTGRPANRSAAASLAATAITHGFLPGAALGRQLGRQDCLGATMALRRDTLAKIGGLKSLLDELADDNVLGCRVKAAGQRIGLAATIPATTVPESRLPAVIRHELRWARTIRSVAPGGFAVWVLQYPLAWALLAVTLSCGAGWAVTLFLAAWVVRTVAARQIDAELSGRQHMAPMGARPFLLPLRDLISLGIWLAAFAGNRVEWRGRVMQVRARYPVARPAATPATEGMDWT